MKRAIILLAMLAAAGLAGAQMFAQLFAATSTARLPAEYQEVEYLQSSGTQYIDTGYKLSSDSVLEIKLSTSVGTTYFICGARTTTGSGKFVVAANGTGVTRYDLNTTISFGSISRQAGVPYTVKMENGTCTVDGEDDTTLSVVDFTCVYDAYLFAANTAGVVTNPLVGKIYFAKILNLDVLIRDYVPCYRKSDSVAGMYDLVNGTFETNDGTGSFIVGPDVE